jgi:hypothetical protein
MMFSMTAMMFPAIAQPPVKTVNDSVTNNEQPIRQMNPQLSRSRIRISSVKETRLYPRWTSGE